MDREPIEGAEDVCAAADLCPPSSHARQVCDGQRPFFIGEFGFAMLSSTEVRSIRQRFPHPHLHILQTNHLPPKTYLNNKQSLLHDVVTLGRAKQGVIGAMLWSLRFRSARGGFFFHSEPWGFNTFWLVSLLCYHE